MPCIYMNAFIFAVGGFASAHCWSSTEYNNNNAWKQNFDNGNQNNNNKNNTNRVRAVRGFKQNYFTSESVALSSCSRFFAKKHYAIIFIRHIAKRETEN